jgi:purine-binding chemotaxis protein CheW
MKRVPPSEGDKQGQDDIQDYLDMLLMQGTEHPGAQLEELAGVETAAAEAELPEVTAKPPAARPFGLTDTAPRAVKVSGFNRSTDNAASLSSAAIPDMGKSQSLKAFAEPVAAPKLKIPLPKVAPAQQEKTQPQGGVPVDKPAVDSKQLEPAVEVKPVVRSKLEVEAVVAVEPETDLHQESRPVVVSESRGQWLANGRPVWAQERFECLLFTVGGLTLAVPLVELGSILPMTAELTPLFGQIDWFMGLLPVKEANIKTVDTAKVVMPERYLAEMAEKYQYVISINDVDWGLAVDNVSEAITLEPSEVRWRSERSKRPWLAGTVVGHMCALLDVSQLGDMFQQQDKTDRR